MRYEEGAADRTTVRVRVVDEYVAVALVITLTHRAIHTDENNLWRLCKNVKKSVENRYFTFSLPSFFSEW